MMADTPNYTQTRFQTRCVSAFDFEATVKSHGWVALLPFSWDDPHAVLSRVLELDGGQVVEVYMKEWADQPERGVEAEILSPRGLSEREVDEIREGVRRMLRLDEDLSAFYQLLDQAPLRVTRGGGRLLRCPTLFEDIVYTLCTTNIAWSGTRRMIANLVERFGSSLPGKASHRAFPTPETLNSAGVETLREEARLGYRSEYVWAFANQVTSGDLDLNALENPDMPTEDIRKALLEIKGIGAYAAATILMLLGRYEHLAIDSAMRTFVSDKYFHGERVTDRQIQSVYSGWGRWRYLAYWYDVWPEGNSP
jgi:3-methyladenine DNA glycosylase/8-oxoguanine DNA glycosylase